MNYDSLRRVRGTIKLRISCVGACCGLYLTEPTNPILPAQLPIEICITGFEFQAINLSPVDIILGAELQLVAAAPSVSFIERDRYREEEMLVQGCVNVTSRLHCT